MYMICTTHIVHPAESTLAWLLGNLLVSFLAALYTTHIIVHPAGSTLAWLLEYLLVSFLGFGDEENLPFSPR